MRVLAVNSLRVLGGGEKWLIRHAPLWRERGFELELACQPEAPLAALAKESDLTVSTVPMRHDISPAGVAGLARLFRRRRPEVVLCCNERAYRLAAPASRLAGVRRLVYRNGLTGTFKNKPHNRAWAFCLRRVVAVSEALHREMSAFGWIPPANLVTIRNGIDPGGYPADERTRLRVREAEGAPAESCVFGVLARLSEDKGVLDALEAFAQTAAEFSHGRLWLAGEGPLRAQLEARSRELGLADRVRVLGFRRDVPDLLQGIDLLVQASHREGLGNSLLEAMASGRGVIASRVGGNPEVVEDAVTGLLVPERDPATLADAMRKALADPGLVRAWGERSRARVCTQFPLSGEADAWGRLLAEVAAGS